MMDVDFIVNLLLEGVREGYSVSQKTNDVNNEKTAIVSEIYQYDHESAMFILSYIYNGHHVKTTSVSLDEVGVDRERLVVIVNGHLESIDRKGFINIPYKLNGDCDVSDWSN